MEELISVTDKAVSGIARDSVTCQECLYGTRVCYMCMSIESRHGKCHSLCPRSCTREMMKECLDPCHASIYGDHKSDTRSLTSIQSYTVLLILRLWVVREFLGPVFRDLLSGRYPDRPGRLRGDMIHELPLYQRCKRQSRSERAHFSQRRESARFTNDSAMKANRLVTSAWIDTLMDPYKP